MRHWYRCFLVNFVNFLVCSFINNEAPAQVLFCEFRNNFSSCNFIKNKTPTCVFSCEFLRVFKNTYLAEHLKSPATNDLVITSLFYKIYCSVKWTRRGGYPRYLLFKRVCVFFNVFNESKNNDYTTTT